MNGTLKDEDDLQFSIEVIEKGVVKEDILKTSGTIETNYKDSLISFESSVIRNDHPSLKLVKAGPTGLFSTFYENAMTAYSFTRLIDKKVTLEKNKPLYLASWQGTTKNQLYTVASEQGEFPQGIEHYELVFLFKVLWTDKENK